MEHRGVRYTIRAGIERDLWSVAIHPGGIESRANRVCGPRKDAEFEAYSMIDGWLERHRVQSKPKTVRDAERK
jgi:hypothetical protein